LAETIVETIDRITSMIVGMDDGIKQTIAGSHELNLNDYETVRVNRSSTSMLGVPMHIASGAILIINKSELMLLLTAALTLQRITNVKL